VGLSYITPAVARSTVRPAGMTKDRSTISVLPYTPTPHIGQTLILGVARPAKRVKYFAMKVKPIRPGLEKRALVVRLRKIKGQIEGIEKMVEADADSSDVLMQVVSARQALKSFSEKVLESHMRACLEGATSRPEGRHNLRSLLTILERYAV
jgi:DNA-binding FrmR family transcriptional regulator